MEIVTNNVNTEIQEENQQEETKMGNNTGLSVPSVSNVITEHKTEIIQMPITPVSNTVAKPLPKHTGCSIKSFEIICKMSQKTLKAFLYGQLKLAGYNPIAGDGYLYAKGEIPILVTAHMDTVHDNLPTIIVEEKTATGLTKVSSPFGIGGDDRCGIWMILEIIKTKELRPYVLFCEDEECGGIGSKKFVKSTLIEELKELKYMIELDRAHEEDAVFYNCDNPDFTSYITETTGYKTAFGSFSDISTLAPEAGIAAVNLSCGYHNPHQLIEYVILEQMENTLATVKYLLKVALLDPTSVPVYKYIRKVYSYGNYNGSYYYGKYYGRYNGYDYGYDDDYDYDWYGYYSQNVKGKTSSTSKNTSEVSVSKKDSVETDGQFFDESIGLEVYYLNPITLEEDVAYATGITKAGAWGDFFINNPTLCYDDVIDFYYY